MLGKFLRRTSLTYATLLIINPLIILCFQNCSLVKLSDLKSKVALQSTESASKAPALKPDPK